MKLLKDIMTTLEIEIAVMEWSGIRANIVVPNVSWGVADLHECDILCLTQSNYATEIEIKISKADILKDKEKRHGHWHNHIRRLFFAVPIHLKDFALANIPERAGLLTVEDHMNHPFKHYLVTQARHCQLNRNCVKWTEKERFQLARLGTMRILGLKTKLRDEKFQ